MENSSSERNVICASEVVENPEVPEANRICVSTMMSSSTAVVYKRNLGGSNVIDQRPFAYPL